MLPREEYVEQSHFFRSLAERSERNLPMQELLGSLREEVLATTKLPLAIDFILAEILHSGSIHSAMERLGHYFTPFQTYVIREAENDEGRFDMRTGLEVLRFEAEYRSEKPTRQGSFMFQFEALCRNRLRYDQGLVAISQDPIYDDLWRDWILTVRRQIGIVDLSDMIYVRSEHYWRDKIPRETEAILFGVKEGRIAFANRKKDPLYLFSALQRHLGYPSVPRLQMPNKSTDLLPQILRRLERLEMRLKLLEEEQKEGIDLTRFYRSNPKPVDDS